MTPLNTAGQGATSTINCTVTNGNASWGTEPLLLNQANKPIARNDDLRSAATRKLKQSLLESANLGAIGDLTNQPKDTAANDSMQEGFLAVLHDLEEAPLAPISRYKLLTDEDMHKLPAIQWRVKKVLPARGTAVLFGPSGSGKSFLVLDMLQSLAFGREWFGHKVNQCSVTYVALEGEAGVAGRIKAYQSRFGSTSLNIRYVAQPFKLVDVDDINALAEAILAAGTTDVVVVDTLSRAIPGLDENDSKAMGQVIAAAKVLQELLGGLLLFIHHTGKEASKGMRGHSSLHAALDCAIEIKRSGDHREWLIAKSKDGEDGASHPFKLEKVLLGIDSDGDEVTSCIVVPNQSAQAFGKKMPTLGSNQTIAHKALEDLLHNAVEFDEEGAPSGGPSIRLDDAIVNIGPLMPTEAKHQKERAKAAIASLVSKGLIVEKEGWLSHYQARPR